MVGCIVILPVRRGAKHSLNNFSESKRTFLSLAAVSNTKEESNGSKNTASRPLSLIRYFPCFVAFTGNSSGAVDFMPGSDMLTCSILPSIDRPVTTPSTSEVESSSLANKPPLLVLVACLSTTEYSADNIPPNFAFR